MVDRYAKQCPLLHNVPMLDVLFDPVDGDDMFFRNVGQLSHTKWLTSQRIEEHAEGYLLSSRT
jgi:hypothetical protein